jgi:PAS domain S-box-containing protein
LCDTFFYTFTPTTINVLQVMVKNSIRSEWDDTNFQFLFDCSPDAYLLIEDQIVKKINKAALTLFNAVSDQIVGKSFAQLSPEFQPDGLASTVCIELKYRNCLDKGVETFTWNMLNGRGDDLWVEVRLLSFNPSFPNHFLVVLNDQSETRKSMISLLESESLFKDLAESIPLSISIVSLKGVVLYINPAAVKLYELRDLEEAYRLNAREVWSDPSQRDVWISEIHKKGLVTNFEIGIKTITGESKWVIISGLFITYKGEKCILSSQNDITERKVMELALLHSEEKHRQLYEQYEAINENLPMGVAVIDREMKIMTVNNKMREWFPSHDYRKDLHCFHAFNYPSKDDNCENCPVIKTMKDGKLHNYVKQTSTVRGIMFYSITASPIKNHEGEIIAVIEMVEDVSERLAAEKKTQGK